jgi:hypothetical protein
MSNIVQKAEAYMRSQTEKNGAPIWIVTEIAINTGKKLSKKYNVDEEVVLLSLYLAHLSFSKEVGGSIQKNHPIDSARLAREFLEEKNYPKEKSELIIKAIEDHHKVGELFNKTATIIKNAECGKFATEVGTVAYYKDLLERGYSKKEAKDIVWKKVLSKLELLTIPDIIEETKNNLPNIKKALDLENN